jgi:hypothetical protein
MTTNLTKEVPKYQNNLPIWKTRLPTNSTPEKTSKRYKSTGIRSKTSYGIMIMGKTFQDLQKSRICIRNYGMQGLESKILHIPLRNGLSIQEVYKLGYYTPYRIVPKEGHKFGVSQSCSIQWLGCKVRMGLMIWPLFGYYNDNSCKGRTL